MNLRQRLKKLEQLAALRNALGAIDPRVDLALRQISDEDLALLVGIAGEQKGGLDRMLSQAESAAVAAYKSAFDAMSV